MKILDSSRVGFFSTLLVALLFGCASIPVKEQLVSSVVDKPLIRSNGQCSETIFLSGGDPGVRISELTAGKIAILDWNIHKGESQYWTKDLLELSRGKDLVFLQEAPLNKALQQVLQDKKMYWGLNSAFKYKGVEMGVLIASSTRPLASCGLRYPEPIIGVPKTILINKYAIAGTQKELLVANIHAINITFGTGAYRQQLSALQEVLELHRGPILLVGDFNNWSETRTEILLKLAEELTLQLLEFTNGGRTTFWGTPVDQILYRGLEPVTQKVHAVKSSDHNPITATFRLNRSEDETEKVTH